jgi:hypothetical protein
LGWIRRYLGVGWSWWERFDVVRGGKCLSYQGGCGVQAAAVEVEVEVVDVGSEVVVELAVEEGEENGVIEEESSFTVEEKLTEGIYTSMLTPVEAAPIFSEEDDDEAEK